MDSNPQSIDALVSLVKNASSIKVRGSENTSTQSSANVISLSALNRIKEYLPDEYTISVEAGMATSEVQSTLAAKGQYLPFDPPFASEGTTIGATIARGLSGPESFRYGILRDFILGVTFIDGHGNLIRAGGKVVKNAAGFDIPKLMSGSCGSFGIIAEASFKVFPVAPETRTLVFNYSHFDKGHEALVKLGKSPFTLDALDLSSEGSLVIKLAGQPGSTDERISAIESFLESRADANTEENNDSIWPETVQLHNRPATGTLLKVPTNPSSVMALESALTGSNAPRRYSIGGYVAWVHWSESVEAVSSLLAKLNLSGQVVSGGAPAIIIGDTGQRPFYNRIKSALDPDGKFGDLYAPTASAHL